MHSERKTHSNTKTEYTSRSRKSMRTHPMVKELIGFNYSDTPEALSEATNPVRGTSFVGCKAGISGMLFSSVCSTFSKPNSTGQRKYGFGNLSCTSAPDVHLPTTATKVVRASADWDSKPSRRKHLRVKRRVEAFPATLNDLGEGLQRRTNMGTNAQTSGFPTSRKQIAPVVEDVGCSRGLSLATDAAALEYVSPPPVYGQVCNRRQRTPNPSEYARTHDLQFERSSRERPSFYRRGEQPDKISDIVLDSRECSQPVSELPAVVRGRRLQGPRRSSSGLAEQLLMLEASLLFGGMAVHDQHRDWRLDIDRMSYEELLELGDRMGYVNTGLTEERITQCLKKIKASLVEAQSSPCVTDSDRKCSICQEEYTTNDDLGKLFCGHSYHADCIKQWLMQKNMCPICKSAAST